MLEPSDTQVVPSAERNASTPVESAISASHEPAAIGVIDVLLRLVAAPAFQRWSVMPSVPPRCRRSA